MKAPQLVSKIASAGDLDQLEEALEGEPRRLISERGFRKHRGEIQYAIVGALAEEMDAEVGRAVDAARSAVRKVRKEGLEADFEATEIAGAEAIIVTGMLRPAILVQEGSFMPPPKRWRHLEEQRPAIERAIAGVCRVEVKGHPALEWVGTGFAVAPGVVMTNRHVVKHFARPGRAGEWTIEDDMAVRVDFAEEFGGGAPKEFPVTGVLAVHNTLDLALLRVKATRAFPEPLRLSSSPARRNKECYVVGYPALDSRRNDPTQTERIFSGIYDIKRLQPGEVMTLRNKTLTFTHDCSTLGGNSGSCVVDLGSHLVVGLHFSGRYLEANVAVSLWRLAEDPVIEEGGIDMN